MSQFSSNYSTETPWWLYVIVVITAPVWLFTHVLLAALAGERVLPESRRDE